MARLKKNTEEGKTGTFEAILKNSGEVVPTVQISNTIILYFKQLYEQFSKKH